MSGSTLVCVLESGDWVWPSNTSSKATNITRCCHACVHTLSCAVFELGDESCRLLGVDSMSNHTASFTRGLVLRVTYRSRAEAHQPVRARRRLRSSVHSRQKRRRSSSALSPLPSVCHERLSYLNLTMAERCGSEHRERFVINECGSSGSSDALAAAQANELYLRRECGATCVFDPAMPMTAGWEYQTAAQCYDRWQQPAAAPAPHRCLKALIDDPAELSRVLGRVSRTCPEGSCEPPRPESKAALHSSGCEGRAAALRNVSRVCASSSSSGPPIVSIDVARAQVNRLWESCRSPCLYSAVSPGATGWSYDRSMGCFRPFARLARPEEAAHDGLPYAPPAVAEASPAQQPPCLSTRHSAAVRKAARTAASLCAECGEPQRREVWCHALVRRRLAAVHRAVGPHAARVWDFDRVQAAFAARGYCRMPCLQRSIDSAPNAHVARGGERKGSSSGGGGGGDGDGGGGGGSGSPDVGPDGADGARVERGSDAASDALPWALNGRWTSIEPVWLGAMQLDLDSSAATRAAVLREWVAFSRRRLDLGAARASSCAGRVLQPRSARTQTFLEVSEAREQMHKNKFVVSDALYIAHVLGRALVEPMVSNSRLGEERPEQTVQIRASSRIEDLRRLADADATDGADASRDGSGEADGGEGEGGGDGSNAKRSGEEASEEEAEEAAAQAR